MDITIQRLSSGYYYIRGRGPCNWAQPNHWPCDEETLRKSAFPEASDEFIRAALASPRQVEQEHDKDEDFTSVAESSPPDRAALPHRPAS